MKFLNDICCTFGIMNFLNGNNSSSKHKTSRSKSSIIPIVHKTLKFKICTRDKYIIQNSGRFFFTRSLRSSPLFWFWLLGRFLYFPSTWLLRFSNAWLLQFSNAWFLWRPSVWFLWLWNNWLWSTSNINHEKIILPTICKKKLQNMKMFNISRVCTMGNMKKSSFTHSTEFGVKKKRSQFLKMETSDAEIKMLLFWGK